MIYHFLHNGHDNFDISKVGHKVLSQYLVSIKFHHLVASKIILKECLSQTYYYSVTTVIIHGYLSATVSM